MCFLDLLGLGELLHGSFTSVEDEGGAIGSSKV